MTTLSSCFSLSVRLWSLPREDDAAAKTALVNSAFVNSCRAGSDYSACGQQWRSGNQFQCTLKPCGPPLPFLKSWPMWSSTFRLRSLLLVSSLVCDAPTVGQVDQFPINTAFRHEKGPVRKGFRAVKHQRIHLQPYLAREISTARFALAVFCCRISLGYFESCVFAVWVPLPPCPDFLDNVRTSGLCGLNKSAGVSDSHLWRWPQQSDNAPTEVKAGSTLNVTWWEFYATQNG